MKDIAIIALIFIAALGWFNANQERNKETEITDHATINCPFPSTFSFVRGTDGTINVHCVEQPLELPEVETHAASTPAFVQ